MKSHRQIVFLQILIAGAMICGPIADTALAHTHWHCDGSNIKWPAEFISWRAGKNSFPSSHPRRTALVTANYRWNEAPGAFMFYLGNWGEKYVGRSNDQNEIWFSTNAGLLDGKPARCFTRMYCSLTSNKLIEADIVFNANVAWSTSTAQTSQRPYGGSRRPWGTTAVHEMGHALGLLHEDDTYNVMGTDFNHIHANNGKVRWYVGEDAGHGEAHLYGQTLSTLKNDVGVVHWKYSGHSGEYSTHTQCRIYKTDDTPVTREDFNGWKRYLVEADHVYKVQFTYENNGYYNETAVNVAYYISTNDWITTYDRLIGLAAFPIKRNKTFTSAIHLRIPWDLTLGQTYYLGVVVDYTNSILEYTETNNATWIPIRMIKEIVLP